MANYEVMLIVDPSLTKKDRDSNLKEIKGFLNKNWKVTREDIWWEKNLAYKINKSEIGFYVIYELDLNWTKIKEINNTLNLNSSIWRYIFVKKESWK